MPPNKGDARWLEAAARLAARGRPVSCPNPAVGAIIVRDGVVVGRGAVIPEINFTLPPIEIQASTWPEIRRQYREMIDAVCERAVELEVPALLVEFETLPPMTAKPALYPTAIFP